MSFNIPLNDLGLLVSFRLDLLYKYPISMTPQAKAKKNDPRNYITGQTGIGLRKLQKIYKVITSKMGYSNNIQLKFELHVAGIKKILKDGFVVDDKTGERIELDKDDYFNQIVAHNKMAIGGYRSPIAYFKAAFSLDVDEIWNRYYKEEGSSRVL